MCPSLPDVRTVSDCTSFSRVVIPFLPSVASLPAQLLEAGKDVEKIKTVYVSTNPLVTAAAFALVLSVVFLIASEVTRNNSQVDRSWSIIPVVYNGHYAIWARMAGLPTKRLDSIAILSVFWGVSEHSPYTHEKQVG